MRILPLLAVLAVLAMFTLGSYSPKTFADVPEEIQQFIAKGEFKNALGLIEQGLEKNAKNQQLLLAKGYLLVKLNQLDAAAGYYKILKTHLADNPEPGNNLAMIYRMQGKYEQAIALFKQTIDDYPDYAHAYENLGDTYIELAHNKYQAGFDSTGEALLKKKLALSRRFHQIAVESSVKPNQAIAGAAYAKPKTVSDNIPAETRELVLNTLDSWTNDWMSRDTERYLSHYSTKFMPDNGKPLKQWIARKKQILSNAGAIKLKLSDIDIQFEQENIITAKFTQEYESATFKDVSDKTLHLEKNQGRWLILKEISEG